jgi:hypothetical protein
MEAMVTCFIPWMRALPDRVALGSFSTELGDVKICLYAWTLSEVIEPYPNRTHKNKNIAPKQTVPGIFRIIMAIAIEKYWPMVSRYSHFATAKLLLDPTGHKNMYSEELRYLTPCRTSRDPQDTATHP